MFPNLLQLFWSLPIFYSNRQPIWEKHGAATSSPQEMWSNACVVDGKDRNVNTDTARDQSSDIIEMLRFLQWKAFPTSYIERIKGKQMVLPIL